MPVFLEIQSKEPLVHLQWSHQKNLLGVLVSTGAFQLFRASFKANKIKEITSADGETICTAFAFSPQCDQIAISNSEGEITVCKIGDNHSDIIRKPTKSSIKLLRWLPLLGDNPSTYLPNPLQKNSVSDKFLPQIEAHKQSKEENITKMNLLHAKSPDSSSLLYSLDGDDRLALLLDGHFQVGVLTIGQLLKDGQANMSASIKSNAESLVINDMFVDYADSRLALLHSTRTDEHRNQQKSMFLSILDLGYLQTSYNTLVPVTICIGTLEELAKNISHTLDSLAATCRAIADLHNQKGFLLDESLNKDERTKGFPPHKDFARTVRTGEQSSALIKMLTGTLLPNEIVQAYAKINNHFNYLVEVLTDSLQSALERSLVIAESLTAEFAKDPLCSGLPGLRSRAIQRLDSRLQHFLTKAEEYLAVVGRSQRQTTSYSAWLYQLAKKLEEKREDTPETNELKPEEVELQNINPSKSELLSLFDSEEAFMLASLGGYVKTLKLPPACIQAFDKQKGSSEIRAGGVQPNQPLSEVKQHLAERALESCSNKIKFFMQKTTGRAPTANITVGMDTEHAQDSKTNQSGRLAPVPQDVSPVFRGGAVGFSTASTRFTFAESAEDPATNGLSFKGLHKLLVDDVAEIKAAFSNCLNANTKLVRTVGTCSPNRSNLELSNSEETCKS